MFGAQTAACCWMFRCGADAAEVLRLAAAVNAELLEPLSALDERLVTGLSMTCRGQLAPLCAFLGGVLGQEVLKALTGKFSPLQQWVRRLPTFSYISPNHEIALFTELIESCVERLTAVYKCCFGTQLHVDAAEMLQDLNEPREHFLPR